MTNEKDETPDIGSGAPGGPPGPGDPDGSAPDRRLEALKRFLVSPAGEDAKWVSLLSAAVRVGSGEAGLMKNLLAAVAAGDGATLVDNFKPQLDDLAGAVLRSTVAARVIDPRTGQAHELEPAMLWQSRDCAPAFREAEAFPDLNALCGAVVALLGVQVDEDLVDQAILLTQLRATDLQAVGGGALGAGGFSEAELAELLRATAQPDVDEHIFATREGRRLLEHARRLADNVEFPAENTGTAGRQDAPSGAGAEGARVPGEAVGESSRLVVEPSGEGAFFIRFDGELVARWPLANVFARVLYNLVSRPGHELHALDLETWVDGGKTESRTWDADECRSVARDLGVELGFVGVPSPAVGALLRRLRFLRGTATSLPSESNRWSARKEQEQIRVALRDPAYVARSEKGDPVMRSVKRIRAALDRCMRNLAKESKITADFFSRCVQDLGESFEYLDPESS